jgi:hypothetical protein
MPRRENSKYTSNQTGQAEHIEQCYEKRGGSTRPYFLARTWVNSAPKKNPAVFERHERKQRRYSWAVPIPVDSAGERERTRRGSYVRSTHRLEQAGSSFSRPPFADTSSRPERRKRPVWCSPRAQAGENIFSVYVHVRTDYSSL